MTGPERLFPGCYVTIVEDDGRGYQGVVERVYLSEAHGLRALVRWDDTGECTWVRGEHLEPFEST